MGRFWTWLRDFANARVRADYMRKYHHDRKCPRCQTWTSEVNGCAEYETGPGYHDWMTCNKCSHRSRWLMAGSFPQLDEPETA